MSRKQYRIDEFIGINQSCTENVLSSAFTCDACNMDTTRGSLNVAKGYVKHIENPVPDKYSIYRMTTFTGSDGIMQYIVATNTAIYSSRGTTWTKIYDYGSQLAMCRFDFLQAKIGSVDYLLISCGERQMVKYDGETASLFGSQEMLSNRSVL
ncbi:MAG: hypothetical protein IJO48_02735, partial [Clostridia bacterium]|nr:hypothetical protein [Clostridia bacterium]